MPEDGSMPSIQEGDLEFMKRPIEFGRHGAIITVPAVRIVLLDVYGTVLQKEYPADEPLPSELDMNMMVQDMKDELGFTEDELEVTREELIEALVKEHGFRINNPYVHDPDFRNPKGYS